MMMRVKGGRRKGEGGRLLGMNEGIYTGGEVLASHRFYSSLCCILGLAQIHDATATSEIHKPLINKLAAS